MDANSLILVALLNALGIIGSGLFPMLLSRRSAIKDRLYETRAKLEDVFMNHYPLLQERYNSLEGVVEDYRDALKADNAAAASGHLESMRALEAEFDECYQPVASRLSDLDINIRRAASVDAKMNVVQYVFGRSVKLRHIKKLVRRPIPETAYVYRQSKSE